MTDRNHDHAAEDRARKAEWRAEMDRRSLAASARVRAEVEKIIAGWRADPSTMPRVNIGGAEDRAPYVVGRGFVPPDSY